MNILITGASGYLGKTLSEGLSQYNLISKSHQELDITNNLQVQQFFNSHSIDCIIHTATKGGKRNGVDNSEVYDDNLKMFNNLVENKPSSTKLIVFGSGAEYRLKPYFYGLSKKEITQMVHQTPNVKVLRLFGCFGKHEEPQRFFKANILNYISKSSLNINTDIKMDFFYDLDLVKILKLELEGKINLPVETDLVYSKKYKLSELAELINKLGLYKVPVIINNVSEEDYISNVSLPKEIESQLVGLEQGIKNLYNEY
jgi:nucleoside-diphosphate-sugar epimerase